MFVNKKIDDFVGILTIDRPEALNAMNPDVLQEIDKSVNDFIKDETIGVIILTGKGEKSFIAGADIKIMQQLDHKGALEFGKLGQKITLTIENSPKPIIAAVNGFALGGGCEISPRPGVEWRVRAIQGYTLWPGNCPPSPGLAP